ncbi:hypothetical protein QTP86_022995, partial [Hemibagrus guttatus]
SISSVSLCCVSLLLFTDLSITMFLVYLWSAAPRPMSFDPSSDVIALRFMLFLSDTYEAVLMLTPLLVAVELLARLLWGGETATSIVDEKEAKEGAFLKDVDVDAWETGQQQKAENNMVVLKALGFLGCLMLWFMCGTYAGFSWRHEQRMLCKHIRPPPERTSIVVVSVSHNCEVDSEKTANSCAIHSSYNKRQQTRGKPEPLSLRTELADGCKLNSESVTLVLPVPGTAPHPHKSRLWQTVQESPCSRGELMTGLLCGLLVCVFPTVLSTNILLVSNLDTLAVYVVKHLLTPLHAK